MQYHKWKRYSKLFLSRSDKNPGYSSDKWGWMGKEKKRKEKARYQYWRLNLKIHTAGEVTEDNEKSLSSGWNFLDRFKLEQLKIP